MGLNSFKVWICKIIVWSSSSSSYVLESWSPNLTLLPCLRECMPAKLNVSRLRATAPNSQRSFVFRSFSQGLYPFMWDGFVSLTAAVKTKYARTWICAPELGKIVINYNYSLISHLFLGRGASIWKICGLKEVFLSIFITSIDYLHLS